MATSMTTKFDHTLRQHVVIREVCDRYGQVLDHIVEHYDGSPPSMILAAQLVTDRMFDMYDDVSNIASRILATDNVGRPRWAISPNFKVVTELPYISGNKTNTIKGALSDRRH